MTNTTIPSVNESITVCYYVIIYTFTHKRRGVMMKTFIVNNGLVLVLLALLSCFPTQKGPYGGSVVSLKSSHAKAEILADTGTGAVLIYMWDLALKKRKPVNYKPLLIGNGDETVDLLPYPIADDSAGYCSRFYGKAEWVHSGTGNYGWLGGGMEQIQHEFNWKNCLRAGESLGTLFDKMDENQGGMMGDGTGDMMKN